MNIELAAPPRSVERGDYKELMQRVIETDGEWLRLSLDEVAPGLPAHVKQTRLWHAATTRKVKVQTTIQEGAIFVRLRKPKVK